MWNWLRDTTNSAGILKTSLFLPCAGWGNREKEEDFMATKWTSVAMPTGTERLRHLINLLCQKVVFSLTAINQFFFQSSSVILYHSFIACQSDQQITRSNNTQDSPLTIWWSIPFMVAFVPVFTLQFEHTSKKNDLVSFFCLNPFQISLVLQLFLETCQRLFRRLDFMMTRKPRKNIGALL